MLDFKGFFSGTAIIFTLDKESGAQISIKTVILAKAGIYCFQCLLDPPVKPEDDRP